MEHCELLITGAGAAGLSAAAAAERAGLRSILILDSRPYPGGILPQCVHRGFGTGLDGREYAEELMSGISENVSILTSCTMLSVSENKTALITDAVHGRREISFDALILASGSYEIPLGALPIAGTRPKGIYTAGQMQELMNLHGHVPEGPALILGSGDIGLIMAWQLSCLELDVTLIEKEAFFGGMARNRKALEGLNVKAIFNSTIREIHGDEHVEEVLLSDGTLLPCKTLLIAAGLKCERELAKGIEKKNWLWLCGNCAKIHSMIESVVKEGREAGGSAAAYVKTLRGIQ